MPINQTLTVAKFGGTSVADYEAMHRCAKIIVDNPQTKVVVVSASSGVTNKLVALTQAETSAEKRALLVEQIAEIQHKILEKLGSPADVATQIAQVLEHIAALAERLVQSRSKAVMDELLSQGEMCSSVFLLPFCGKRARLRLHLMCVKSCVQIAIMAVQSHKLR